jgi:hypothetical protein
MNYGMPNRVGRVLSEKMKNASTYHEIEYAVFIKIENFRAFSTAARARESSTCDG